MRLRAIGTAPIFEAGFDSLNRDIAVLRRRIARGRERRDDRADLEACELDERELRALWRATLRAELELGDVDADGLDRDLIVVEELIRDGLSLRTIPPETREALKREREADYARVLYNLADDREETLATT